MTCPKQVATAPMILSGFLLNFLLISPALGAGTSDSGWADLFNGRNLDGWELRVPDGPNGWRVENGLTINKAPSTDLLTKKWYKDFDLHVEFLIPTGSNSGLYLLGRYEIQIQDDFGKPVNEGTCGALYREIAPLTNACKPAGEWQTMDIHMTAARFGVDGRKLANARVSVRLNDVLVLDDVQTSGPTGSRKRYDEEAAGPVLIQGDHGDITFRSLRIRGPAYDPPGAGSPAPAILSPETKPRKIALARADGLTLTWRTPNQAYAPAFRVYRGRTPDFPIGPESLCGTAVKRSFEDAAFETDGTYYYRVVALNADARPGAPSEAVGVNAKANQVATSNLADASWALVVGENDPSRRLPSSPRPLTMHGKPFDSGIVMRGHSAITMFVGKMVGSASDYRLRATIGLDDSIQASRRSAAACRFIVELDDKKAFDSGVMKWADGARDLDLPVPAGARKLELIVRREGTRGWDYGNWANVRLERASR